MNLRSSAAEEARCRKARIVAGAVYDGLGCGVLCEEWTTRYPDGFVTSLAVAGNAC